MNRPFRSLRSARATWSRWREGWWAFTVRLNCWELLPTALLALMVEREDARRRGHAADDAGGRIPRLIRPAAQPLVTLHVIGVVPVAVSVCE